MWDLCGQVSIWSTTRRDRPPLRTLLLTSPSPSKEEEEKIYYSYLPTMMALVWLRIVNVMLWSQMGVWACSFFDLNLQGLNSLICMRSVCKVCVRSAVGHQQVLEGARINAVGFLNPLLSGSPGLYYRRVQTPSQSPAF